MPAALWSEKRSTKTFNSILVIHVNEATRAHISGARTLTTVFSFNLQICLISSLNLFNFYRTLRSNRNIRYIKVS